MSKSGLAAIHGTLAATEDSDRTRKTRKQPQGQHKRWREAQLLPALYAAHPDWRNGIPSKAELSSRDYLSKCRLAVRKYPDTHHLLSDATDSRLDKTLKRIRDKCGR
jgi:hypothetical protein